VRVAGSVTDRGYASRRLSTLTDAVLNGGIGRSSPGFGCPELGVLCRLRGGSGRGPENLQPPVAYPSPRGPLTLLDAFEGRRQLIVYYFMWWDGDPAAGQCEGCTWVTTQVTELSYLHSRDITYAVFCQGPYDESSRYRDFMGWDVPWYSAQPSLGALLAGRQIGLFHLVCYLRDGDRVFETYWTKRRGAEAMDYSYALMDLTVYGRQERWEDSPPGWPQQCSITRTDGGSPDWPPVPAWPGGRPIAQWPRLRAGRSDDLGAGHDGH
jgi:hypothetical protein